MKLWLTFAAIAVVFFGLGISVSGVREINIPVLISAPDKILPEPPVIKEKLLPDLIIFPPKELYISRPNTTTKTIRFSTTVANVGKGPFEVIGHTDKMTGLTYASQYMKNLDGTGSYKEIGQFVFHDVHRHWHIENYVQYQLWTLTNENSKGEMLSSSDKLSFCLWDVRARDLDLVNSPQTREYTSACTSKIQGISVGWEDTYLSRIEGQSIDISSVPDGRYYLGYEVNPNKNFEEIDYSNNSGGINVEISGNRIREVE